jgi:16S rRNA (cytidine1402-2'-O)-methyltransferase
MSSAGVLYLVSTPMGDPDELSPRAARVCCEADVLVCEEWKSGRALMRQVGLERDSKELLRLNEHNVEEGTAEILQLLREGNTVALFSDSGAPVFADPGKELVVACQAEGIRVTHISGASALVSALLLAGFPVDEFYFLGWLPRKTLERDQALKRLQKRDTTTVVMETPYRLIPLLTSVKGVLGKDRLVAVCGNLTTKEEFVRRGRVADVLEYFENNPQKPEFVLMIGGCNQTL